MSRQSEEEFVTDAASPPRLPDFMIIGAAKGGTTALYQYLARHPAIFLSTPKEPEFFSRDSHYVRGLDWYRTLFAAARVEQTCGEASTTYTRWPHWGDVPERIARAVPKVRMLYIMRDPVDRAYSHYMHHMRSGVRFTFEEALQQDPVYVDCGMYMRQIQRFLSHFPREQFCFLLHEDLRERPHRPLAAAQKFLGVPARDLLADGPLTANAAGPDHYLRHRVTSTLDQIPGAEWIATRLPNGMRQRAWVFLRSTASAQRLKDAAIPPPMLTETRDRLRHEFAEDVAELQDFLGMDLTRWLPRRSSDA